MAQKTTEKIPSEISEKIKGGVISYLPFQNEPDPKKYFDIHSAEKIYLLPQDPKINPFEESKKLRELFGDLEVVIFIPGTAFDIHGTRHGRGGGWYDRFLSAVPRSWLRVGLCHPDQFSTTPLVRESWDEAVDYGFLVE